MKNERQIRIGAALSYVSIIVNLGIQLIYTPLMLRLLGQSEYGLYTLVTNVVSYLSLFSLGFTGAYLRYYSQAKLNDDKREVYRLNGMFLTIFMVMAVVAVVCGFILAEYPEQIFGDRLSVNELMKAKLLMQILVVNIAISFPMSVFDSIISSQEKFIFQKILSITKSICSPLITLPCLILGYGSVAMVSVTTLVGIVCLGVSVFYCLKKLDIRFAFDHFAFEKLKSISEFSFFVFLNMIIDQLNWSIDNLILGRASGVLEVAIYGVASQLRTVFQYFSTPVSNVYAPTVNRIVADHHDDMDRELTGLMIKVGRIQFMILLYVFVGFVFCGRLFIQWWAGEKYVDSYLVTLCLVFPLVYVLPCGMGIEIRRAKNMHRFPSVILLLAAFINCCLSIPLAIRHGALGTAFATGISMTITIVWLGFYYTKRLKLDILKLYRNILLIAFKEAIPIAIGLMGLCFHRLIFCFGWAILYSILYGFFLMRFVLNRDEKKVVEAIWRKISLQR